MNVTDIRRLDRPHNVYLFFSGSLVVYPRIHMAFMHSRGQNKTTRCNVDVHCSYHRAGCWLYLKFILKTLTWIASGSDGMIISRISSYYIQLWVNRSRTLRIQKLLTNRKLPICGVACLVSNIWNKFDLPIE